MLNHPTTQDILLILVMYGLTALLVVPAISANFNL